MAKKKAASTRKTGSKASATGAAGGKRKASGTGKSGGKSAAKPKARRKVSSRRELIDTGTDKRYVRRSKGGQFKESDDVSRSLSADRRRKATTTAKRGQGDRGD